MEGGERLQRQLLVTTGPLGTLQLPGSDLWLQEKPQHVARWREAVQQEQQQKKRQKGGVDQVDVQQQPGSVEAAAAAAAAAAAGDAAQDALPLSACSDVLPPELVTAAEKLLQQRLSQLRAAVRRQVDWYFSPSNWKQDHYLRDQAVVYPPSTEGREGGGRGREGSQPLGEKKLAVPLQLVLGFPRLQRLTRDAAFVVACLQGGGGGLKHVEVSGPSNDLLLRKEGERGA
ncbi:hypothetical protein cyc_05332 [Cyclospora cayetanensis]|nr:hypothetical protein cyc_05332 [Cyclospora cayetanensis]